MSISRQIVGLRTLMRRRPLLFNSIVYGSFYTGAEFAQQSYNRKYRLEEQPQRNIKADRFVAIGASTKINEIRQRNESSVENIREPDYDWKQLQRYATYGCFIAGPVLHGCLMAQLVIVHVGLVANSTTETVKSEKLHYEWMIMAHYALLGTFVYSPIYYYWYKWLDRIFRATTMRIIMVKLVADQFILTPPLLVLFFVSMSYMESREDIIHECKMKFANTFQTSCIYWIPVQFVNFLVVPPALRVLYVSVAAFCWVNILCYLKRMPVPKENLQVEE